MFFRRTHPGNHSNGPDHYRLASYEVPGVPGILIIDLRFFGGVSPSTITVDKSIHLPYASYGEWEFVVSYRGGMAYALYGGGMFPVIDFTN